MTGATREPLVGLAERLRAQAGTVHSGAFHAMMEAATALAQPVPEDGGLAPR